MDDYLYVSSIDNTYIERKDTLLKLTAEGIKMERMLSDIEALILQNNSLESLELTDQIIKLFVCPGLEKNYNLMKYYYEAEKLAQDGFLKFTDACWLLFFIDQNDMSLFLTSDQPLFKEIAKFRLGIPTDYSFTDGDDDDDFMNLK